LATNAAHFLSIMTKQPNDYFVDDEKDFASKACEALMEDSVTSHTAGIGPLTKRPHSQDTAIVNHLIFDMVFPSLDNSLGEYQVALINRLLTESVKLFISIILFLLLSLPVRRCPLVGQPTTC
jgi:hypothetical protein